LILAQDTGQLSSFRNDALPLTNMNDPKGPVMFNINSIDHSQKALNLQVEGNFKMFGPGRLHKSATKEECAAYMEDIKAAQCDFENKGEDPEHQNCDMMYYIYGTRC
jgi:hypothetical protein